MAKKDGYRFACDVIAGKTTNPSNWPYFRLGLFCASTRCSHWYEHWFGHVHFLRHWVAQLLRPWFTLRNYVIIAYVITREAGSARRMRIETTSRGGFTDVNWNVHQSVSAQIRIEGTLSESFWDQFIQRWIVLELPVHLSTWGCVPYNWKCSFSFLITLYCHIIYMHMSMLHWWRQMSLKQLMMHMKLQKFWNIASSSGGFT